MSSFFKSKKEIAPKQIRGCRQKESAYFFSGQGAIEMNVTAIHEHVLAGDVTGLSGRNEKQGHGRDLLRLGHSLAQGNFRDDVPELLLRIGKRADPLLVQRS